MTDNKEGASKEALLCIGSNCGNREGNVAHALAWLAGIMADIRHSSIYATPDCHGGQRVYMNAVAIGKTTMDAVNLEAMFKKYELLQGRDREARDAGDVPVDVDIVAFDGEVLRKRDYASEFFLKGLRELEIQHSHCAAEV